MTEGRAALGGVGSILSALFRVLSLEAHWRGAKMAELMCKALS